MKINVSFMGLLFLLFLTLKLVGTIDWSWWWVTAPLWGGFALVAVIFLAMALFGGISILIIGLCAYFQDKQKKRKK